MAELATDTFTITKTEYDEILSRLGNLELLVETLRLDQSNAKMAADAATVPETATYQCRAPVPPTMEPHGYTFTAIHPSKWFAGMGPIECPHHPGQPNMVTCIDMEVSAAQAAQNVLDPGIPVPRPAPPTVVQTGPSLSPPGSATLPPPPPALPATVVGAANNPAYEPPSPPPPLPVAAETSSAAATEPVATPPADPETEANP